jgi:hypothetical protein
VVTPVTNNAIRTNSDSSYLSKILNLFAVIVVTVIPQLTLSVSVLEYRHYNNRPPKVLEVDNFTLKLKIRVCQS